MTSDNFNFPDKEGFFGEYGGKFVPETLMYALEELENTYNQLKDNSEFIDEFYKDLSAFVGRPSPLYFAQRLTDHYGSGSIWLKREDLNHTGAHKINNCIGQILLARRMRKKRIVAETGAGQHGLATATVCALFDLECIVYMGKEDISRQAPNVFKMKLLGAKIIPVESGTATLKDAMNEALRDWVSNVENTFYVIGTAAGPHPYPLMVRTFASIIGRIAKKQMQDLTGKLPSTVFAVCGGGSNLSAISYPYYKEKNVNIFGIESAGKGIASGAHAATITGKAPIGILLGARSNVLMDEDGQINESHTEASGLDFSGTGPEICYMASTGKISFRATTDKQAQETFLMMCRKTGILPAIEACYVIHAALKEIKRRKNPRENHLIHLCGSGESNVGRMLKYKRDNE